MIVRIGFFAAMAITVVLLIRSVVMGFKDRGQGDPEIEDEASQVLTRMVQKLENQLDEVSALLHSLQTIVELELELKSKTIAATNSLLGAARDAQTMRELGEQLYQR